MAVIICRTEQGIELGADEQIRTVDLRIRSAFSGNLPESAESLEAQNLQNIENPDPGGNKTPDDGEPAPKGPKKYKVAFIDRGKETPIGRS